MEAARLAFLFASSTALAVAAATLSCVPCALLLRLLYWCFAWCFALLACEPEQLQSAGPHRARQLARQGED